MPDSTSGSWWPEGLSGCQDVLIEFESCDNIIISFIIYWTTCYRYSVARKLESVEGSSQVTILCNSYLIHQHIPLIPANILSQVSAHYSSFSDLVRPHSSPSRPLPSAAGDQLTGDGGRRRVTWAVSPSPARAAAGDQYTGLDCGSASLCFIIQLLPGIIDLNFSSNIWMLSRDIRRRISGSFQQGS